MNRALIYLFFSVFLLSLSVPVWAQDTEEDPYADYSYLWEDTKKKKKKKKKNDAPEVKTVPDYEPVQPEEEVIYTPPADTLIDESPVDSLQQEEELPLDSLEEAPQEEVQYPVDSLDKPIEKEPLEEVDEEEYQEPEIEKAPKEKKGRKDRSGAPPVQDFRSGMGTESGGGSFDGGLTVTQIDDQYFVGLVLNPEFSIGKVGVGLNVPVLYGLDDQSIRTEIFKDGVGAARLITYIRYGVQKADPVYVKVGQLNNTMVGFGGLINNYTNSTSFEKRKVGLHYDLNVKGLAGIDGLYSDFSPGSFNLFAIRPYVRPMAWTPIPIVRTFEFGATIVRDKDQSKIVTSDSTSTSYLFTRNGIGAFGLDMGVTLLRVPFIQIDLFATYSKLNVTSEVLTDSLESNYATTNEPSIMSDGFENGSGASVGINFRFHFIADILSTDVRIERLNYSDHYLPQFFDATYEINKDAKIYALGGAEKMSGFYGSLTGHILKKVQLGGSLMIPDDVTEATPATVRVNADLDRLADKFSFHGSYIKGNLTDLGDTFKFDERSLAKLRVIYHLNKFLAAGFDYYWAFTPTADGGYKPTKYVSPYFGVSVQF